MTNNYNLYIVENLALPQLIEYINRLINTDFAQLINLLYRLDISEAKLKQLLASQQQQNAGELVAVLIIERLHQKKLSREQFKQAPPTDEYERW